MPAQLPYVLSPTSIKNALERIREAATPPKFTNDFVNTILLIKGGTGTAIAPFMKRIGLVASDGSPTELYKRFRNQVNGGSAIAQAIKTSYKELGAANEYFYKLPDNQLYQLILQVTGADKESRAAQAILGTLKVLKKFADFDADLEIQDASLPIAEARRPEHTERTGKTADFAMSARGVGLNLAYTINLNLPATTDQAVFNAIFKSLRENLLSSDD